MNKFDNTLQPCYTCLTVIAGGDGMTPVEIIKDLISKSDIQQKELGEQMGWTEVATSNRLRRNTLSAADFIKMVDILGYEIKIVEKGSDEEVTVRKKGVGERLRMMVNGIKYDTAKSDALCHSDPDGFGFYELYKDDSGRYFVAHYSSWEGGVNTISPISEYDALAMIRKMEK